MNQAKRTGKEKRPEKGNVEEQIEKKIRKKEEAQKRKPEFIRPDPATQARSNR